MFFLLFPSKLVGTCWKPQKPILIDMYKFSKKIIESDLTENAFEFSLYLIHLNKIDFFKILIFFVKYVI
jgi:hypothetical protein